MMKNILTLLLTIITLHAHAAKVEKAETNRVTELSFNSSKTYENPFMDIQVDVVFEKDGREWKQPAFWNGGKKWTVRFAFPETGKFKYRVLSGDPVLSKKEGMFKVQAYKGKNPLLKHGLLQVSKNKRYFEHTNGTPFFWMGDTWWKCLSKRISFDEFKELTDDRAEKGFSLAQVVCGPYPDEEFYTDWWDNEGGKPYLDKEFTKVNLDYFKYADQRFEYMIKSGIVPAIVGAWGRSDCDAMRYLGVEGMKRHWRNLIARYGAYPTVWIAGGEAAGELWSETSRYIRKTDPFDRPISVHIEGHFASTVEAVGAECVNFDFLQTGHGRTAEDEKAIGRVKALYNTEPHMPVLNGEHSYEEHMKAGPPYTQRYVFWGSILNGACGLTYGAAGIWHAGIEGFPASVNTYDFTTWRQGMVLPGSAQVGLNANFLRSYSWTDFKPHAEWVSKKMFAAGIPGDIRMIYMPRPRAYQWEGFKVFKLEKNVPYEMFFFDPSTGRRFDYPTVMHIDSAETIFEEDFSSGKGNWKDEGALTKIEGKQLISPKDSLTILDQDLGDYFSVSAIVKSNTEAGIVVNYQDKANYLLAVYAATETKGKVSKKIFFRQVINGEEHELLGGGAGPLTRGARSLPKKLPENLKMSVTVQGSVATVRMQGGKMDLANTVDITVSTKGKIGLWKGAEESTQSYDDLKVVNVPNRKPGIRYITDSTLNIERLPSPQDWVLVMEKAGRQSEKLATGKLRRK